MEESTRYFLERNASLEILAKCKEMERDLLRFQRRLDRCLSKGNFILEKIKELESTIPIPPTWTSRYSNSNTATTGLRKLRAAKWIFTNLGELLFHEAAVRCFLANHGPERQRKRAQFIAQFIRCLKKMLLWKLLSDLKITIE